MLVGSPTSALQRGPHLRSVSVKNRAYSPLTMRRAIRRAIQSINESYALAAGLASSPLQKVGCQRSVAEAVGWIFNALTAAPTTSRSSRVRELLVIAGREAMCATHLILGDPWRVIPAPDLGQINAYLARAKSTLGRALRCPLG